MILGYEPSDKDIRERMDAYGVGRLAAATELEREHLLATLRDLREKRISLLPPQVDDVLLWLLEHP